MPENGLPKPQERPIGLLHQSHQKRLIKYLLDTAFSEKALIIDIKGESGEASRETSVESRGQLKK